MKELTIKGFMVYSYYPRWAAAFTEMNQLMQKVFILKINLNSIKQKIRFVLFLTFRVNLKQKKQHIMVLKKCWTHFWVYLKAKIPVKQLLKQLMFKQTTHELFKRTIT